MHRTLIATTSIVAALVGLPAVAAEGVELSVQSRQSAAASSATVIQHADAPFRTSRDPMPEILLRSELESRGPRGSCEVATTDVCYDMREAKIVYRRARDYMPKIDGLRAESVSLRRSGITFKYSF